MKTLKQLETYWEPTAEKCMNIHESFCDSVNNDDALKALRDYVEQNAYGMGERSFYWMWRLICYELRGTPTLLEIGVHRGQVLALWRHLLGDKAKIWGISPFTGIEIDFHSNKSDLIEDARDYKKDVYKLFDHFNLKKPSFIVGMSDNQETIDEAAKTFVDGVDVLYIDGGHTYETTRSDIINYSHLIKPGGFLVIDDCANKFPHPWGYFAGIDSVALAVDRILPPKSQIYADDFEHLAAVVHNRIWRKKR